MMTAMAGTCPSDETLVAHVAGDLADERADSLRDHLDGCVMCRDVVLVIARGTPPGAKPELAPTLVAIERHRETAEPIVLPPRYAIDRLLGQGGMGRVYAARDTELDRLVAVKVMRRDFSSDELEQRFVRESRLMARLSHPGVVTIYDVGRHEGHTFIAMELIAGVTLQRWLAERRHSWREILDVCRRAGEGIAAAHHASLIHRDIKPDNILLAVDGDRVTRVAVSDFGVARAAAAPSDGAPARGSARQLSLTAAGAAIGTPAYMAPEQLAGRDVDARADVFAFGVTLWEALWGERPYRGASVAELEAAMATGTPSPPAGVPRWLARGIRSAIEPDVEQRPASMEALLAVLDPARHALRRTRIGAAALGVAIAAGAGFVIVPKLRPVSLPPLCDDAGLTTSWDDRARGAIRGALESVPGEVAAGVSDRALHAGDGYAQRWSSARAATCALDDPRRRDAELACLDARRRGFTTLVSRAPGLSRANLLALDTQLGELPSIELCGTDAAQLALRDVRPGAEPQVAALEARLAELDTRRRIGDAAAVRGELAALAPQIAATGSRVLEAEQLYARAQAAPDTDTALALYRDAAIAAAKVGRDDLAATAWLEVARQAIDTKNDGPRAAETLALADGAIARGGEDRVLRASYDLASVQLATFQSKFDDASKQLAALRGRAERDAPNLVEAIDTANIQLLTEAGKFTEAIAASRTAIVAATRRYGESHEATIKGYTLLSHAQLGQGDGDGAVASTRTALELTKRGYGADSDSYGLALRNLGVALDNVGKTDEAVATFHEARAALTITRGARSFMVGDTYQSEAVALSAAQRYAESLPLFDQALAIYRDSSSTSKPRLGEALLSYATTLAQLDRGAEAVAKTREAVVLFRDIYGETNPRYAYARATLGEALIHAHDKRAARVELEAAVAVLTKVEFDPTLQNAAVFNLAQALIDVPAEHARALDLAKQALAFFKTAGPQWKDVVDHIQLWITRDGRD